MLVSAIGEVSRPLSRIHSRPVKSPQPLSVWQPANSGSTAISPSCGTIAVTPVRTGPSPTTSGPASPSMSVTQPTATPATSVMAFSGPGRAEAELDAEVAGAHQSSSARSARAGGAPPASTSTPPTTATATTIATTVPVLPPPPLEAPPSAAAFGPTLR